MGVGDVDQSMGFKRTWDRVIAAALNSPDFFAVRQLVRNHPRPTVDDHLLATLSMDQRGPPASFTHLFS